MVADYLLAVRFWAALFIVGCAGYPLTRVLFGGGNHRDGKDSPSTRSLSAGWWDDGYLFAKAVGLVSITSLTYFLGSLRIIPFTMTTIVIASVTVFLSGLVILMQRHNTGLSFISAKAATRIIVSELFFFFAFIFWAFIKSHEPSIHGLEKFMDFGFTRSILNTTYFPASDMWYAGHTINYYYFGHIVLAMLTRMSGLDLSVTFNLMLAAIFAFTLTMSFSIGVEVFFLAQKKNDRAERRTAWWALLSGMVVSYLVTLAGNMQTIFAFTKAYETENPKPFWQLLYGLPELWQKLPESLNRYWYANATRFIPFTIHEFPSYSFVVSDVHGHVLSLPFALLAIAMLIRMFGHADQSHQQVSYWLQRWFYGLLTGVLLMTNATDGPIYLGLYLFLAVLFRQRRVSGWQRIRSLAADAGLVIGIAALTSLPFLFYFKSFVTGVAINCPPQFLADRKFGPIIFEGVEKCQKSALWMLWLLWGFFWFCGAWMIGRRMKVKTEQAPVTPRVDMELSKYMPHVERVLMVYYIVSVGLIIFPEFFYFKDIYPAHFRSNTMFKLGYQAFLMWGVLSGYIIVKTLEERVVGVRARLMRAAFFVLLVPQLVLVSIYPFFSVRSYFNSLKTYTGINGLAWFENQYPDDWAAVSWLNKQIREANVNPQSVILEADGDSYTDHNRFSVLTGIPTVVGWAVHEWLWRGTYDVVAPRRNDVAATYEGSDTEAAKKLLGKYNVRYVIVGSMERGKYKQLNEEKFLRIGKVVFRSGQTVIYNVGSL